MSLPKSAAPRVNWVPVSCMPSPLSPANRIVTRSSWRSETDLGAAVVMGLRVGCGSGAFGRRHPLVRPRREVQELLGERFGEVLQDVDRTDDADEDAIVVDQRDVAVAARLHEVDGVADRLVEVERPGMVDHERLDGLVRVDAGPDELA